MVHLNGIGPPAGQGTSPAKGVDAVRRQLARNISLHVTIKQDGERFTVFEKSKLRSKELTWTSGEEVEGEDPDGTKIKGTFTLEAPNKYVGQFQRMSDGKQIKISREVDGDKMLQEQDGLVELMSGYPDT
ncbi:FABPI protein, partial [Polypterus senegalus]|nr:FABPI protein [Polypterus senegalus]